jgi:hypothetical protein
VEDRAGIRRLARAEGLSVGASCGGRDLPDAVARALASRGRQSTAGRPAGALPACLSWSGAGSHSPEESGLRPQRPSPARAAAGLPASVSGNAFEVSVAGGPLPGAPVRTRLRGSEEWVCRGRCR